MYEAGCWGGLYGWVERKREREREREGINKFDSIVEMGVKTTQY
jgi:hypothetical protein